MPILMNRMFSVCSVLILVIFGLVVIPSLYIKTNFLEWFYVLFVVMNTLVWRIFGYLVSVGFIEVKWVKNGKT